MNTDMLGQTTECANLAAEHESLDIGKWQPLGQNQVDLFLHLKVCIDSGIALFQTYLDNLPRHIPPTEILI